MLVQIAIHEVMALETDYAGVLYCTSCGAEIGPVSKEELKHLLYSDNPDDILCFGCESLSPLPEKDLGPQEATNLQRIFEVTALRELPISATPVWSNPKIGAHLQLIPNKGWCLWYPRPDNEQALRAIRISYERGLHLRELFDLHPRRFAGSSLVL